MKRLNKKGEGEEGPNWYIISIILALVLIFIYFTIIRKSGDTSISIIDNLKGMF